MSINNPGWYWKVLEVCQINLNKILRKRLVIWPPNYSLKRDFITTPGHFKFDALDDKITSGFKCFFD
ncbi:hypothetical protein [Fluoribacter gormanii]|uniref:hypothetical protein n=1 Tax=Fluoribacter gormanii TaxID=464 RepID=UPI000730F77D|nr:hypothetical protein [Fluoribacter gormanii]MCW8443632.1 hypothetical protein [Fluoribacter gormanii]